MSLKDLYIQFLKEDAGDYEADNCKNCDRQSLAFSEFCNDHLPDKNKWIFDIKKEMSNENEFEHLNFYEADLSGIELSEVKIINANFAYANLQNASFIIFIYLINKSI